MVIHFTQYMLNPINYNKIFVVIPAYNEQDKLHTVVSELLALNYSVVIVDDGSKQPLKKSLNISAAYLLTHKINLGQGAALQTGVEFACSKGAEYIVTFDADGQHRAADIDILVNKLFESGSDVALGSRFIEGSAHNMSFVRKWLIQIARFINFIFTGLLLSDAHNGLRAMTAKAAQKIKLSENRMAHATEFLSIIKSKKLKHTEVPVQITYSDYSRAKGQSAWDSFRIFFDILLNKIFK